MEEQQQKKSVKELVEAATRNTKGIRHVIGVVGGKGGVGKSLVTALLAIQTSKMGYRTAVLDADITGPSVPKIFGIGERAMTDENNLLPYVTPGGIKAISLGMLLENETDPVFWRGPVISGVVKQFWEDVRWGELDYLFVDMPPGTGDVPLTVFQSIPVSGIVVVSTPQSLVSVIVQKAIGMAEKMNIPILGLVENMQYLRCPDCGREIPLFGTDEVVDALPLPVLERLPLDPALAAACDSGRLEQEAGSYGMKTAQTVTAVFEKKEG